MGIILENTNDIDKLTASKFVNWVHTNQTLDFHYVDCISFHFARRSKLLVFKVAQKTRQYLATYVATIEGTP